MYEYTCKFSLFWRIISRSWIHCLHTRTCFNCVHKTVVLLLLDIFLNHSPWTNLKRNSQCMWRKHQRSGLYNKKRGACICTVRAEVKYKICFGSTEGAAMPTEYLWKSVVKQWSCAAIARIIWFLFLTPAPLTESNVCLPWKKIIRIELVFDSRKIKLLLLCFIGGKNLNCLCGSEKKPTHQFYE